MKLGHRRYLRVVIDGSILESSRVLAGTVPAGSSTSLPVGRRDRAAAADQDAGERTLEATEDAADDRADAGAGADLPRFAA